MLASLSSLFPKWAFSFGSCLTHRENWQKTTPAVSPTLFVILSDADTILCAFSSRLAISVHILLHIYFHLLAHLFHLALGLGMAIVFLQNRSYSNISVTNPILCFCLMTIIPDWTTRVLYHVCCLRICTGSNVDSLEFGTLIWVLETSTQYQK